MKKGTQTQTWQFRLLLMEREVEEAALAGGGNKGPTYIYHRDLSLSNPWPSNKGKRNSRLNEVEM